LLSSYANLIDKRFGGKGLWSLFLLCAFPIHLWSIIVVLNNVSVINQRDLWFFLGYASYSLVFAFFESIFVFICVILLSFLIPKLWQGEMLFSLFGVLVFVVVSWAIIDQTILAMSNHPITKFFNLLSSVNPWLSIFIGFIIVLSSVVVPIYFLVRSAKLLIIVLNIFERIVVLSIIYAVLDFAGLIVIIVRNLQGLLG